MILLLGEVFLVAVDGAEEKKGVEAGSAQEQEVISAWLESVVGGRLIEDLRFAEIQ